MISLTIDPHVIFFCPILLIILVLVSSDKLKVSFCQENKEEKKPLNILQKIFRYTVFVAYS